MDDEYDVSTHQLWALFTKSEPKHGTPVREQGP